MRMRAANSRATGEILLFGAGVGAAGVAPVEGEGDGGDAAKSGTPAAAVMNDFRVGIIPP